MNDYTNDITLIDLYYQRINFFNLKSMTKEQIKLNVNHKYEFQKSNDLKNIRLVIKTTIKDENNRFSFELESVAIFGVKNEIDFSDFDLQKYLVSIAWPFVRQEVQLVTTQPGIMPIVLPINVMFNQRDSQDMYA